MNGGRVGGRMGRGWTFDSLPFYLSVPSSLPLRRVCVWSVTPTVSHPGLLYNQDSRRGNKETLLRTTDSSRSTPVTRRGSVTLWTGWHGRRRRRPDQDAYPRPTLFDQGSVKVKFHIRLYIRFRKVLIPFHILLRGSIPGFSLPSTLIELNQS